MQLRRTPQPDVAVVTRAARSHSEDIGVRQRRYLLTQSVRIVCVVLATLLPVSPLWKGVLIAGAVALPWFGVVMANAGPTVSRKHGTSMVDRAMPLDEPVRLAIDPGRVVDAER